MKTSFKMMMLPAVFATLALSLGVAAGEKDVEAAVLPGTDLVTRVNVRKLMASPFYVELTKEDPAKPAAKNPDLVKFEDFFKQLGMTYDDIGNVVLTVDFEVPPERKDEVGDTLFLVGVESAKPWDLKKLSEAIAKMAEEEAKKPGGAAKKLEFETLTIDGTPVLKIRQAKKGAAEAQPIKKKSPDDAYLAISPDGKVLLLTAFEPEMKQALARLKEQKPIELDPKLKALCGMVPESQVSGGFLLTEKMKAKLMAAPAPAAGEGGNPMTGMQDAFRSLSQVGWSVKLGKDAAVQVKTGLGSVNDAAKGATAVNGFIAMMRGMMAMQQQGQEVKLETMVATMLFDNIRIANVEQDVVLDILFSAEWAAKVKELAAKKAADARKAPIQAPAQEE
jgi:hypothetical protein